jgi:2-isopropylmalate synthase
LDSFANALNQTPVLVFDILDFHEHSVGSGTDTQAIAYVQIKLSDGRSAWGVGKSSNVGRAGIAAVVSAINICYEN